MRCLQCKGELQKLFEVEGDITVFGMPSALRRARALVQKRKRENPKAKPSDLPFEKPKAKPKVNVFKVRRCTLYYCSNCLAFYKC
jgi:hypothetical protein